MKNFAVIAIALASISFVTACKKTEKKTGSSDTTATKPTESKDSGPFGAWDMPARTAAFQGAHVAPSGSVGFWEAWEVKGGKVTVWDGKAEKTFDLKLISPCEVKVSETVNGGTQSTTTHYTLKDGKIVHGLGDAGSRKGPEAIACVSNKVFTVDAKGACTEWSAPMFDDGKYEQKPGTCGFRKDGDKDVFAVTVNGHETSLQVHGDALLSEQLANQHSEKVADFAAAKAARDAKK